MNRNCCRQASPNAGSRATLVAALVSVTLAGAPSTSAQVYEKSVPQGRLPGSPAKLINPPRWVANTTTPNNAPPANAFAGGSEPGRVLYVCRAAYNGGVHPGKVVDGNCNIGWGGKEVRLSGFDWLVGVPRTARLVPSREAGDWSHVLAGGWEAGGNPPLHVCVAEYSKLEVLFGPDGGVRILPTTLQPGKVTSGGSVNAGLWSYCNFGFDGEEIREGSFRVLVIP